MGIGISVLLLAVGAVITWAITGEVQGVDLDIVGVILMAAGGIGLIWALAISSSMPWRRDTAVDRERVVHER